MSARAIAIAEALVDALNAAGLSQALNAERKWVPQFKLEDEHLRIAVKPDDLDWELISRDDRRQDYECELWATKRLESDPESEAARKEEIDGLVLLAQELMDYLEEAELEGLDVVLVGIACDPICDEDAIQELGRFSTVIKVKYRLLR